MDIELKTDYIEVTSTDAKDILNPGLEMFNYPNPFNPTTTIYFNVATEGTKKAELIIYNLRGQQIRQFSISNNQSSIIWDGTDQMNNPVSSGIYYYKVRAGTYTSTRKMLLMK
jgi:flagellar hook assembly protein FlgD